MNSSVEYTPSEYSPRRIREDRERARPSTAGAASSQSQSNNAVPSRLEEEARLTPKHVRCESEGENGEVVCVLDDPLCWETQEVMRVPRDGLDHKMRHLHRG